jgi:16S rRNA processing protein RimM
MGREVRKAGGFPIREDSGQQSPIPDPHSPLPRFTAGVIGAPFGLEGFVKVKTLSGEIDHLLKLKSVVLRQDGKERVFAVEESAPKAPVVVMRFAGFHSPQDAKALAGAELIVSREDAAALKPGEFYVEDLKGLSVLDERLQILGHISAVIEGGGGELAEITLNNGKIKLVPFRKEFFTNIDLENRQVTLSNLWILE